MSRNLVDIVITGLYLSIFGMYNINYSKLGNDS